MQILLLATGEAEKLRPITARIPSPLIPVMNRPIMLYNLELLGRLGFRRILVSVHTLAGSIERYFGDGRKWGLSLEYIIQRDALGTAGALRWAKRLIQEPVIVMPADIIADVEVARAIEAHVSRKAMATVVVQPGLSQRGQVLWKGYGDRIQAVSGKPLGAQAWTDLGIYILDPSVLEHIPPRTSYDIHHNLLPKLLATGVPVFACPLPGYWNPLDTLQDYVEAQQIFFSNALKEDIDTDDRVSYRFDTLESRQIARGIWVGRNTRIHPEARILPIVSVGEGSWVGREVELGPDAIIGSEVVIDQGARIQHSIVLDGTYIGKMANLDHRLVNQDQLVDLCTQEELRITDPILLGRANQRTLVPGFKRPVDFLLSILLLLITLPLTLPLALLLRLTTGQVFKSLPCLASCTARRNGQGAHSETFNLLHFNTCRKDERTTRFGKWVERWEGQRLPELINVLKGDMAMVGLKPVTTEAESAMRASWQLEQHEVPAGFTGLWYLQTEVDSPLEEMMVADAYYLAIHSLAEDWKVLSRTPSAWIKRVRRKEDPLT